MVDTPRTLAEVQALLADNNTGDITPQDLRDLVESIVDPIPGGGFDQIPYNTTGLTFISKRRKTGGLVDGLYDVYDKSAVTTLQPGYDMLVDWRTSGTETTAAFYDPAGWLNNAPIADSGWWGTGSWPVGTLLLLPPGVYGWQFFLQAVVSQSAGGFAPYIDHPFNQSLSSSLLKNSGFGNGAGTVVGATSTLFASNGGFLVYDEPTYILPDIFGTSAITATGFTLVEFNLVKIR